MTQQEELKIDYPYPEPSNVHQAIINVMSQVGYVRKMKASGLNYSFAGEAALISSLRPYMVDNGLYMHVEDVELLQQRLYQSKSGTEMNEVSLKLRLRFTHAGSGTSIAASAIGMGADTGDKSVPKAMTGGYKYALREVFLIETGDDPDKDPSVEAAVAKKEANAPKTQKQQAPAKTPAPAAQQAAQAVIDPNAINDKEFGLAALAHAITLKAELGLPQFNEEAARLHLEQLGLSHVASKNGYVASGTALVAKLKREQAEAKAHMPGDDQHQPPPHEPVPAAPRTPPGPPQP